MTVYAEDTVHLIKEKADITDVIGDHVKLIRAGANFKGLCPFHSEKTPSFFVNPARNTFHCFGCNEGGDVFTFLMKYHNLTFPEAIEELAGKYNIPIARQDLGPEEKKRTRKREGLFAANKKAADLFHEKLLESPEAEAARKYLEQRGLSEDIIRNYRLGFAPDGWDFLVTCFAQSGQTESAADAGLIVAKNRGGHYDRFRNRLVFPLVNITGKIVGFSGRILGDGQPKYLNSPESPVFDKSKTLFGLFQNKDAIRRQNKCILVEGNFDLLALVDHGLEHAAAPLGTALTQSHIRALKGYADEIIMLFDGDSAGIKAAIRAVPLFLSEEVTARVAVLPDEHDPDTYLKAKGPEGLTDLLEQAQSLADFLFDRLVERYGLSLEGKNKIVAELQKIMAELGKEQVQRSLFASHFSSKLGIEAAQLLGRRPARAGAKASAQKASYRTEQIEELPFKQRQLIEFLIFFPEYLQKFLDAGIEEVINNRTADSILSHLKEMQNIEDAAPEKLLDIVTGPVRSFISGLLINNPVYSDEIREALVNEHISWLKKTNFQTEQSKLTKMINKAQQDNDMTLCMALIEKKKALDEALLE